MGGGKTDMKTDIVIWSYERPAQLDLLIRSIYDKYFNHGQIFVLLDYQDVNKADKIYKRVMDKYPDIVFYYSQGLFKTQMLEILSRCASRYVLGLCDDDVFIKDIDIDYLLPYFDDNVHAISLKHGREITHCYPNRPVSQPHFLEDNKILKWQWYEKDIGNDWYYGVCINTYIYRTQFLYDILNRMSFNNPTTIEGGMHSIFNLYRSSCRETVRPYLISPLECKILNIPVNRVQNLSPNRFGIEHEQTTEYINNMWNNGNEIDNSNIYDYNNYQAQHEIKFLFRRI